MIENQNNKVYESKYKLVIFICLQIIVLYYSNNLFKNVTFSLLMVIVLVFTSDCSKLFFTLDNNFKTLV